ncbi:MAG: glycosyltransferase [Candidatus Edwardsbacteria bacterium]|nr:glycosyltransferase [Candidatus Edwardsbacteria bacterium]
MKRLLVLNYYHPPQGGVHRVVKFIKYLPQNGWQPVVIAPHPRGIYRYDDSLSKDLRQAQVFRTGSLDPMHLSSSRIDPETVSRHRGFIELINNFFIPDNKIGWVPFAVQAALKIFRQEPFDAIFSSAPPFSSHLAGLSIKRLVSRPLVCDFRDAWSQPNTLNRGYSSLRLHLNRRLEGLVVRQADMITAINAPILEGLQNIGLKKASAKVVLPQGFDPLDFLPEDSRPGSDSFIIAYTGSLTKYRRIDVLARALRELLQRRPPLAKKIKIILAGVYKPEDLAIARQLGLSEYFEFRGHLAHDRIIEILEAATVLWFTIGREEGPTVSTSKVYEYLGARKPILASIPDSSPAAQLIRETGTGTVLDPDDHLGLADQIGQLFHQWQNQRPVFHPDDKARQKYDRRLITQQLAARLNRLV